MGKDRSTDPVWTQRRVYVALNALAFAPLTCADMPAFYADCRSATRRLLGTTDLRTARDARYATDRTTITRALLVELRADCALLGYKMRPVDEALDAFAALHGLPVNWRHGGVV